ncbi:DUF2568 domain-containing protein [Tropicimonas marinistellae]|uniref:DUF2568 domain-containing protein n=1 Tax=Tropicimonas marinistellae TaxID=1739787 RepID=UPI000A791879|nr:DUF2568 domain-containing protein [Tropicimonas marinistellae]
MERVSCYDAWGRKGTIISAWNLALRFLLELAALAGLATYAWGFARGLLGSLCAVAAVAGAAAIWTVFAVPDDPSRSGHAPVPVPGAVRLCLELVVLFGGALAFHAAGWSAVGAALALLIAIHYALSTDRIMWLLAQ